MIVVEVSSLVAAVDHEISFSCDLPLPSFLTEEAPLRKLMRQDLERVQSPGPRPNTPELGARQGHRNAGTAQLLTSDGSISDEVGLYAVSGWLKELTSTFLPTVLV